ncbi:MAG: hypothetical protein IH964_10965 [Candidatus Dadabacteria bacterium]|nr:hypothetical protein [Candidatus Dadabacteria bacterium]
MILPKILLIVSLGLIASCAGMNLTPATEVAYEGELVGNENFTYPSAGRVLETCLDTKTCMGLSQTDYPLPKIRGMRGGNAVECGVKEDGTPKLKQGCYTADGFITVPEGGDLDVIGHECVHHWLLQSTGDLDPLHSSSFFLKCSGGLSLTEDSE